VKTEVYSNLFSGQAYAYDGW